MVKSYIRTKEHCLKISESLKGRHLSDSQRKNISLRQMGTHLSEETKMKISNSLKGIKRGPMSDEHKKRVSIFRTGKGIGNIAWFIQRGVSGPMLGKHHSDVAKEKIRLKRANQKMKTGWHQSEQAKAKYRLKRMTWITPIKNTKIEVKIQNFLKELNIEFKTHRPMNEIKHFYPCDIFIPSGKLVIECDGEYWHNYPVGTEIDKIRTKELLEKGFKVLRLWGDEIKGMSCLAFKVKMDWAIKRGEYD